MDVLWTGNNPSPITITWFHFKCSSDFNIISRNSANILMNTSVHLLELGHQDKQLMVLIFRLGAIIEEEGARRERASQTSNSGQQDRKYMPIMFVLCINWSSVTVS